MDLMMPIMNGQEASQKINQLINEKVEELKQPLEDTTIIAFSAMNDDQNLLDSCYQCGFKGFLNKPPPFKSLLKLFQSVFPNISFEEPL